MSTAEALNNAIVALDWRAPSSPAGTKRAVTDLAKHWVNYWNSAERRLSPPLLQAAKLERYAAWYARAWALMPAALRDTLAHPSTIDASVWAHLEDQLTYMAEGNAAAAKAAAKSASAITRELKAAIPGVLGVVVVLGGVAVAVALAVAKAKPRFL